MSSGSFTSPGLGFNNTGKPAAITRACPSGRYEARGPGALFAGLCGICGRVTTHRTPGGQPQHEQIPGLIQ